MFAPDIDGESQLDGYAIWGTNGTAVHVDVKPPVEWMHVDPVIPGDDRLPSSRSKIRFSARKRHTPGRGIWPGVWFRPGRQAT